MEEAKVVNEEGFAYFVQEDLRFPIAGKEDGITRAVDVLDKLNSGMWQRLAALNHLPTDPFDKKLLKVPLMGIIQIAWYRAFDPRVDFEKLLANQEKRVAKYKQDIETLKANPDVAEGKKKSGGGGGARTAKTYQLDPAKKDVWSKFGGQKQLIVDAMQKLGPATAAVIADSVKGQLQTRQPAERVVAFYMNDFGHKGLLSANGTAPSTEPSVEDEPKQSEEAAAAVKEATPQEVNKPAKTGGKKKK